MSINLKELDILRDAIKAEIEDNHQYKLMAERIEDTKTSILCRKFANDEAKHRQMLESHYEKLSGGEKCYIDPEDLNLQDIPEDYTIDPFDLIRRSIEKEKAGNEYYTSMAKVVKDKNCKALLENLATVEQMHENELKKLLR
jgi:rubrerythrin